MFQRIDQPGRSAWHRVAVRWGAILLLPLMLSACHSHPIAATTRPAGSLLGLNDPIPTESVEAIAAAPAGWVAEPLKHSSRHDHQVWLSPTGSTAYGVIRIHLPWPVGPDLTLTAFLREMKRTEGEGTLISREDDPKLPGIRFVAEGGLYRLRGNLVAQGWTAWVIYAGTLRAKPEIESELILAERAREATIVGLPEALVHP